MSRAKKRVRELSEERTSLAGHRLNHPPRSTSSGITLKLGSKARQKPSSSDRVSNTSHFIKRTSTADDDKVEEYTFSSDDGIVAQDDYDSDAARSHISLSSNSSPMASQPSYALDDRPWLLMDQQSRRHYENMFLNITSPALGGSWAYTEEYQKQIDETMLKYIEDFPYSSWVIGREAAEAAFNRYQERVKWRQFGVRVYKTQQLPELFLNGQAYSTMQGHMPAVQQHTTAGVPTRPNNHAPVVQHVTVPAKPTTAVAAVTKPAQPAQQVLSNPTSSPSAFNPAGASAYASILLFRANENRSSLSKNTARSEPTTEDEDSDASTTSLKRKYTPLSRSRAATPPYPRHESIVESESSQKAGKQPIRRQAEAGVLPWHRNIDFKAARAAAEWNDEYREAQTTASLKKLHARNAPIFERLDREHTDRPDVARGAQKVQGFTAEASSSPSGGDLTKDSIDNGASNASSGSLVFASVYDHDFAKSLGCTSTNDVIERGEDGRLTLEDLRKIRLCWNPGKKMVSYGLEQLIFTARESVITRQMLNKTPVLTWNAALCIIDFCPDLMFREVLLRICSEAGMGNRDARNRYCLNGYYTDKATFTKRLCAALGQKQPRKNRQTESDAKEVYEHNSDHFDAYINFFGRRTTLRTKTAARHPRSSTATSSSEASGVIRVPNKRVKLTPLEVDGAADTDMEDSVSAQDSDDLDSISD